MGCVSSKAARGNDDRESQRPKRKASDRSVASSRREEIEVADVGFSNDGSTVRLISKPHENVATSPIPLAIDGEKKVSSSVETIGLGAVHRRGETMEVRVNMGEQNSVVIGATSVGHNMVISHVPNGFRLEHTAAGWPSWLTAVAGEAVKGWLPRRADTFEKLNKVSSSLSTTILFCVTSLHL